MTVRACRLLPGAGVLATPDPPDQMTHAAPSWRTKTNGAAWTVSDPSAKVTGKATKWAKCGPVGKFPKSTGSSLFTRARSTLVNNPEAYGGGPAELGLPAQQGACSAVGLKSGPRRTRSLAGWLQVRPGQARYLCNHLLNLNAAAAGGWPSTPPTGRAGPPAPAKRLARCCVRLVPLACKGPQWPGPLARGPPGLPRGPRLSLSARS